jgi:hypothetical protein
VRADSEVSTRLSESIKKHGQPAVAEEYFDRIKSRPGSHPQNHFVFSQHFLNYFLYR